MEIQDPLTNETILTELGNRLQRIRLDRNIPQSQLAREAGVSLSTVTRLESGKSVQLDSLMRLMRALHLTSRLNLLVPEPLVHPVQLLQAESKKKQRVSKKQQPPAARPSSWKWGDEQ